jgi:hypothetical protein
MDSIYVSVNQRATMITMTDSFEGVTPVKSGRANESNDGVECMQEQAGSS